MSKLIIAAVRSQGATVKGRLGSKTTEIMVDSGSSISLVIESLVRDLPHDQNNVLPPNIQLVSAAGDPIPVIGNITASIQVGNLSVYHPLVVVQSLIVPVILGMDFLQQYGLTLDFTTTPVTIQDKSVTYDNYQPEIQPVLEELRKVKTRVCAVSTMAESVDDTIDDYAVPTYAIAPTYDLPECHNPLLATLLETYKHLFLTTPGKTNAAEHFIPTTGNPVKIPPRRIPVNYRAEVEQQLTTMLQQGVIEVSSSPWMAPAVFVRKKNGEIRMCVDYRELNKKTVKDAYPLPRPDEVQDQLMGCTVFSTLDLKSGYWQLPVHADDRPKTAFCPGPGFGLFQFCRMPFGLTGAPSSFQRLMNRICGDLPFVTTYLDDLLVYSKTPQEHKQHLEILFDRISTAGLTLRGNKCHIGLSQVTYLGHTFTADGMSPEPQKVSVIRDWAVPTDTTTLKSFLGLASYYRRYIHNFADIAAPLHQLTNKGTPFTWTLACQTSFEQLKYFLTHAPILKYPDFSTSAQSFQLYTDASATGIGAVLEQSGHVIAYASRTLTGSEKNYSVIQRECLAVVYALKQFRHYLLGRPFAIVTDHAPLQWLSAQKMEGLLARWALAIQEYEFTITYRRGKENGNADALSRKAHPEEDHVAMTTQIPTLTNDIYQQQCTDSVIQQLRVALLQDNNTPPCGSMWRKPPFSRYKQLWSQLCLHNEMVCRRYTPTPHSSPIVVPIIPESYRSTLLHQNHNTPAAGHLGFEKTAARVREVGYWVGMLSDIEKYCRECTVCQSTKPPAPANAPLVNVPIGQAWEMVAVDILEVPVSQNNNRYLLVVQDYMTKWVEAIPIPNQTAKRITTELVKIFSRYGLPDILHSDQGSNFESTILHQTLDAFGVTKSRTTAYHPAGDGLVERFNRSLLQMLRAYVQQQHDWEQYLPLVLYAYRTAVHASTGVSPFELMFGRQGHKPPLPSTTAHDVLSYQCQLRAKLAQLADFVESHNVQAHTQQKHYFDQHTRIRSFTIGDPVWLSIPTAGKLDPRWEGGWKIKSVQNPTTYTISDGGRIKTVHINRLQPRVQAVDSSTPNQQLHRKNWEPPQIEHDVVDSEPRYPSRTRRPPTRYQA